MTLAKGAAPWVANGYMIKIWFWDYASLIEIPQQQLSTIILHGGLREVEGHPCSETWKLALMVEIPT